MSKITWPNENTLDTVNEALERIATQAVSHGEAEAYLCTLQLPPKFSSMPREANDIYKKIQSDFCKCVYRSTGTTPRYVTVKSTNENIPEYLFCLFTKREASLENVQDFAEKGREISTGKCLHAGWGKELRDVVDLFREAPRFTISNPISTTKETMAEVMPTLRQHLHDRAENTIDHQRTIFVSKSR